MGVQTELFYDLGRQVAGPLLREMLDWLFVRIARNRPHGVCFFSRDGEILYRLWQRFCPRQLADLPVIYLLVSRRALQTAIRSGEDARRAAYLAYLERSGLHAHASWAVVDIGWHGSLQTALSRLLPGLRLEGYYLGWFGKAPGMIQHGWLFEADQPLGVARHIQPFVEILEFIFSADQPSLVGFALAADRVEPQWAFRPKGDGFANALGSLRSGIDDFFRLSLAQQQVYASAWRQSLWQLGLAPDPALARALGQLTAVRGIDESYRLLAFKSPALCNLLNWNQLLRQFKAALWRPGFWAQCNLAERTVLRLLSPHGAGTVGALSRSPCLLAHNNTEP